MMDLVLIFVTMYWQSYKPTGQCIPHETHDNIWAKLEHHPLRYSHLSKYNTIHLTYDNGKGHPKDHFAPIYFLQRVVFDILFEFLAFVSIVPWWGQIDQASRWEVGGHHKTHRKPESKTYHCLF
jgi:hypothetical protein